MTTSVIDLFSIGIGPSSSHTVGPMRAALEFTTAYPQACEHPISITLHGSLAATGIGHGTDRATILGLAGFTPTTTDANTAPAFGEAIPESGSVTGPHGTIRYELEFDHTPLPGHPNAVTFRSADSSIPDQVYYSIGGGFITQNPESGDASSAGQHTTVKLPHPFNNGRELLAVCEETQLSVAAVMLENEAAIHGDRAIVIEHLDAVWETMQLCVATGMKAEGILPGGLQVRRRAKQLHEALAFQPDAGDSLRAMEWVNLYALAVNEENAAGGAVVTAPTNGASGIIPAVMHFAHDFFEDLPNNFHRDFLLAAGAIGMIIKNNASISGAEVGCQGEVGSASAMAAAGLSQITGGSPEQVEHASEIALEHNLGLTCDPVGGLVQIPCIERNALGAVKSINAARLARHSTGHHIVSLDDAVKTMADTGRDMSQKYKETATGGLAVNLGLPNLGLSVNLPEC